MSKKPYDYTTRKGIRPISWEDFHGICKALAKAVFPFQPEIILAIGRGGYYPGTLLAHMLQVEIYPVRLSRRVNDVVQFESPQWLLEPPPLIEGRRLLIVDEICDSGETITMVKEKAESLKAKAVKSAVMYAHTWGASIPDYIGLVTDDLLLNPWDREILRENGLQFNPEYVGALAHQGIESDPSLLIQTPSLELDKE
jgi:hypoxanthine phosphoribosyltransferase